MGFWATMGLAAIRFRSSGRALYTQKLAGMVNATSPDIDTFRAHGHKLLMYHGWSDWLVAPGESINYYNAVLARDKAAHSSKPLDALISRSACSWSRVWRIVRVVPVRRISMHWARWSIGWSMESRRIKSSPANCLWLKERQTWSVLCVPILALRSIRGPVIPTMLPVSSAGNVDALTGKNSDRYGRGFGDRPRHCQRFAAEGARVVIADLEQARPEAAAAEIAAATRGQVLGIAMDVTDEDAVGAAVARTIREFGGVDILCSNAGNQIIGGIHELTYSDWKKVLAVHLDGAFLTTRACLRHMYAPAKAAAFSIRARSIQNLRPCLRRPT